MQKFEGTTLKTKVVKPNNFPKSCDLSSYLTPVELEDLHFKIVEKFPEGVAIIKMSPQKELFISYSNESMKLLT